MATRVIERSAARRGPKITCHNEVSNDLAGGQLRRASQRATRRSHKHQQMHRGRPNGVPTKTWHTALDGNKDAVVAHVECEVRLDMRRWTPHGQSSRTRGPIVWLSARPQRVCPSPGCLVFPTTVAFEWLEWLSVAFCGQELLSAFFFVRCLSQTMFTTHVLNVLRQ